MFAAVSVSSLTVAPDGRTLAFVKTRSLLTAPPELQSNLVQQRLVLGDIWLQDESGRPPRNLTRGESDGTGAWNPIWAPDGRRLAFLSTRGGREVSLWVWERVTNKIRLVPTPGVKYLGNPRAYQWTFRWLDATRILCFVGVRDGDAILSSAEGEAVRLATDAWARAARGEVTASVLKSNEFRLSPIRLWLVDVASGAGRTVATTVESPYARIRTAWLSPDGRWLAYVRPATMSYNFAASLRMGMPFPVEIQTLDGGRPSWSDRLPDNIHATTLKWSPDGKELAFFANGPGPIDPVLLYGSAAAAAMPIEKVATPGNPAKFYRVNVEQGTVVSWETGDVDLGQLGSPEFHWTAQGEIVVSAARRRYGWASGPPPSRGASWGFASGNALPLYPPTTPIWWVVERSGNTRRLAPENVSLPNSLQPFGGGSGFVCLRTGELWRVDPQTGSLTNITAELDLRVTGIESGVTSVSAERDSKLLVRAVPHDATDGGNKNTPRPERYYLVDLRQGTFAPLASPIQSARLVDFTPATSEAIYLADGLDGTFVWRTGPIRPTPELILRENAFAREIEQRACRIISYTSLNGEPLGARLCLPEGYVNGRRYPIIVDARYGSRYGVITADNRTVLIEDGVETTPFDGRPVMPDILRSAGYAYLWPSIPARLQGTLPEEGDAAVMTLNGILPAVEAVISSGIADPQRLFLFGHSRGGWTVLTTIGQTTRFKAAVSAEYADGARSGTMRHAEPFRYAEGGGMQGIFPGGTMKVYRPSDLPWWRDGDMLRRNNPLTYVDRVQTPVMLVHSDLDGAPFDESEDYFYALVSMRKPAQFVRYWGEGHAFTSPANVRDFIQRTLAWYDLWGDIARDSEARLIFDGERVRSRNGAPPLTPEDFARIGPAASSLGRPHDRKDGRSENGLSSSAH